MGMRRKRNQYNEHNWVYRDRRWKYVRHEVKRRDGWKCVQCGNRTRLEVDHIISVTKAPERAFDLTNLQTLCGSCHSRKTRSELGFPEISEARRRWRDLVGTSMPETLSDERKHNA